jgi:hypothetical protein
LQLSRDELGVWLVGQVVVVLSGSQELRSDQARVRIDVLRRDVVERGADLEAALTQVVIKLDC